MRTRRLAAVGAAIGVLAVVVIAGAIPIPANAHAVLIRSDPAQNARLKSPPRRIDLFFSEALNHMSSTVHVLDAAGARIEDGPPRFTADPTEMQVAVGSLAPGYYTVAWTTLSAVDGHSWQGSYPFAVLTPAGTLPAGAPAGTGTSQANGSSVQPFDAVLRWLLLLGLMGIAGGFGFALLVTLPAARRLAEAPRLLAERYALHLVGACVPAAALMAAIVNPAALLRAAAQNGSLSSVLAGQNGVYALLRELLVLTTLALAVYAGRRTRASSAPVPSLLLVVGLALAAAGLLTMSLTSHAAAGTGAGWAVPADFLHLGAAALWLGGLVQLPLVLTRADSASGGQRVQRALEAGRTAETRGGQGDRFRAVVLHRFSTLALGCVAVILFTGAFNALVQLPSWQALADTTYGQVLLLKLALVALLLALGALNAVRLGRRFEHLAAVVHAGERTAAQRLARGAAVESAAGAAVIAATAVLVFLVPARDVVARTRATSAVGTQPAAKPYQRTVSTADLHATLSVTPNQPGENTFTVELSGPDADRAQRVQLRFGASDGFGGSAVTLEPRQGAAGSYTGSAANLSQPGRWSVTVNVRRAGHDDVNLAFGDDLKAPGAAAEQGGTWRFPAHGVNPLQVIAAAIAVVAFLPFAARFTAGRIRLSRRASASLLGVSSLAAVVALVAAFAGGSGRAASGPTVPSLVTTVTPTTSGQVTVWRIPTPGSGLMTPAVGPDGRIWISEMNTNKLAALDPARGQITEYMFNPGRVLSAMGVAVDGAGRVWMAEGSVAALGMLDPASGAYSEYHTPTPNSSPSGVALDRAGHVWLTELGAGKLAAFDPSTRTFTEYAIPGAGAVPYWLTVAPSGDVWFTDIAHGQIGVLHQESGSIELVPIAGVTGTSGIAAGTDGTIWFGGRGGKLGQFDPTTRTLHLTSLPNGDAYGVAIDHRGTVWVGTTGNTVYGVDPKTGQVQTVTAAPGAWWTATAPDGAVWVAAGADDGNALGRVTLGPPAAHEP